MIRDATIGLTFLLSRSSGDLVIWTLIVVFQVSHKNILTFMLDIFRHGVAMEYFEDGATFDLLVELIQSCLDKTADVIDID